MLKTFAFSSKNSIHIILFFFFFFLTSIYIHHVHSYNNVTSSSGDAEKSILRQLNYPWLNPPFLHYWNSSSHHCTWPGISCSLNGSVEGIAITHSYIGVIIPPLICDLKNLIHIDLSFNLIQGPFPTSLCNCSKLKYLNLSRNYFDGSIPKNIDGLLSPHLEYLDLSNNRFYGGIPAAIGNITALKHLDLSGNYALTGTIPHDFGKLKTLLHLDLSYNQLSGRIPTQLAALPYLSRVNFRSNQLAGPIPSAIGGLSGLRYLDLSDNEFSGEITSEFGNLSMLGSLDLSVNSFSGKLPSEIGDLLSLEHLDLSHNEFSGKIPSEIGKLSGLLYLDLSDNTFSGQIPPEISLANLYFVNLSSNRLCGSIPEKFKYSFPASSFSDISDSCKSNLLPPAVLSLAVVILLIMAFTFYIWRRCNFTWYRLDSTWKLIPFQKLDFTASTILSSLTESNLIGRGGSGNVYKVQVNSSGKYVAVKRICSNEKMDERLEKQFLSELKILGTIRHLNILKLMCSFSSENSKLLVYEYMENGSLYEWLHGKRRTSMVPSSSSLQINVLEWPKRLNIAIAIAQGLCYMHHFSSPPIIHRDIKSSNILLDSEFNAKIADFGLARILDIEGDPRTMSVIAGTFGYIAPECAQTSRVNEKVDVYSFGVILLELVTGRKAHQGDENSSLAEWAWHHIQHGNPIDDALDDDIKHPNYLDEMIKVFKLGICCTRTLPSNRPTTKEVQEILHLCAHPLVPREDILLSIAMNSTLRPDWYFHRYLVLGFLNYRVD